MMLNPPRYTPRLVIAAFVLLTFFVFTFLKRHTDVGWAWRLTRTRPDNSERWNLFLNRIHDARPASDSLFVPEGYILIRVEEINETTSRLDNAQLSEDDLVKSKAAHAQVLDMIPEFTDLVQYKKKSQGIVTVAGGSYSQTLIVSIRMLRKTKCKLPIEVFIPEENSEGNNEFDDYTCNVVLKSLNARCVKLPKLANITLARYSYKSVALLFSNFEDTLFIDADIFPLIDPSTFFSAAPYTQTGLLTWPDFWAATTSHIFYDLVGQNAPSLTSHASTEAGAMVISRKRHATTLLLAFYYNIYGPGFFYELLSQRGIGGEGDKETWVAAARVLNQPYYQVRERNHALVWAEDETQLDEITAMVQMDPISDWELSRKERGSRGGGGGGGGDAAAFYRNHADANIVFVHANRVKMNPSAVLQRLEEFHGQRRMWGPKDKTLRIFGHDLEADLWDETIHVACYNGRVLLDAENGGEGVCRSLRRFWWRILMEEELELKLAHQIAEDERERMRGGL